MLTSFPDKVAETALVFSRAVVDFFEAVDFAVSAEWPDLSEVRDSFGVGLPFLKSVKELFDWYYLLTFLPAVELALAFSEMVGGFFGAEGSSSGAVASGKRDFS